jgi:hypothetical protein
VKCGNFHDRPATDAAMDSNRPVNIKMAVNDSHFYILPTNLIKPPSSPYKQRAVLYTGGVYFKLPGILLACRRHEVGVAMLLRCEFG